MARLGRLRPRTMAGNFSGSGTGLSLAGQVSRTRTRAHTHTHARTHAQAHAPARTRACLRARQPSEPPSKHPPAFRVGIHRLSQSALTGAGRPCRFPGRLKYTLARAMCIHTHRYTHRSSPEPGEHSRGHADAVLGRRGSVRGQVEARRGGCRRPCAGPGPSSSKLWARAHASLGPTKLFQAGFACPVLVIDPAIKPRQQ